MPIYSQIGLIRSYDDPLELLSISEYMTMYRARDNSMFTMEIHSDNEYEDVDVELSLGTGGRTALNSILNLIKAIESSDGKKFDIQGYTFESPGDRAYVISGYNLAYTAGSYIVRVQDLKQGILCCYCFTKQYDDCILSIHNKYIDRRGYLNFKLIISIPKYNLRYGSHYLNICTKDTLVNNKFNLWETDTPLTIEQKENLKECFKNRELERTTSFGTNYACESQFVYILAAKVLGIKEIPYY